MRPNLFITNSKYLGHRLSRIPFAKIALLLGGGERVLNPGWTAESLFRNRFELFCELSPYFGILCV